MVEIPSFVVGLVVGLIFSALISPLIWDAIILNFDCEDGAEQIANACKIAKNALWLVLFVGPPVTGLSYVLKRGR